jgi:hypothetical protein
LMGVFLVDPIAYLSCIFAYLGMQTGRTDEFRFFLVEDAES